MVLGIPVSSGDFEVPGSLNAARDSLDAVTVTFVNPHACALSQKHEQYIEHLQGFDWVLCDGIGMVYAARKVAGMNIQRAAFDLTSLAGPVLAWLADKSISVVLVGGRPGIAEAARERFTLLYPKLDVVATFNGYEDSPAQARRFLAQNPQCAVICGMGAPKQEEFLQRAKIEGWQGIGFTCGGFFDQIAEKEHYFPRWVDKLNLRFAYRLVKEPGRLWRRYLIEYQVFLKRLFSAKRSGRRFP